MNYLIGSLLLILLSASTFQDNFLQDQRRYPRVREAMEARQQTLQEQLQQHELEIGNFHLLMIAYKDDDLLELYAKEKQATVYQKITEYEICSRSGTLGPKRQQGDYQVPEGFYHIDRFNPASNFHLSVGLNYPNLADQRKSKYKRLGGDIFIHGACVTIGCLPMTDDKIKEIYLYAIHARNNGQQKIPVYIFPFRMTDENLTAYTESAELDAFWSNLKVGYDQFMNNHEELRFSVASNGDYQF